VYLGYDEKNNTYIAKEWVSGRQYYTADLTMHPSVFPYRANPTRTPGWLQQYDVFAPHVIEGTAGNLLSSGAAPRRSSARQHEYQYSSGQDVRALPDMDVPPGEGATGSLNSSSLLGYSIKFGDLDAFDAKFKLPDFSN
jgi:hypothetical protein